MAKVKCVECEKRVDKELSFTGTIFNKNGKEVNKNFCSIECKEKWFEKYNLKENFYSKLSELTGVNVRGSVIFNKKFSELGDKEPYYELLRDRYDNIYYSYKEALDNAKSRLATITINYKLSLLLGVIEKTMRDYTYNSTTNPLETIVEPCMDNYMDYESLYPKGKQVKPRTTYMDLLNSLEKKEKK